MQFAAGPLAEGCGMYERPPFSPWPAAPAEKLARASKGSGDRAVRRRARVTWARPTTCERLGSRNRARVRCDPVLATPPFHLARRSGIRTLLLDARRDRSARRNPTCGAHVSHRPADGSARTLEAHRTRHSRAGDDRKTRMTIAEARTASDLPRTLSELLSGDKTDAIVIAVSKDPHAKVIVLLIPRGSQAPTLAVKVPTTAEASTVVEAEG